MSRIQISLSDTTLDQLRAMAQDTPVARIATRFLISALTDGRSTPRPSGSRGSRDVEEETQDFDRPSWLEPFDERERREWRQQTWGDVLAFYTRYPKSLMRLPEQWWRDTDLFESVCALAAWRVNIDVAGRDPREELYFHAELEAFRHMLERLPGGVEGRFEPGAAPDEWFTGW
jgi:hypothetical protein